MTKQTQSKKRTRPKKKTGPKPSIKGLRNKLDRAFSWYVRLTHADQDGNCTCVTCGKVLPWHKIQCGHFVSRKHKSTRWRLDNCKPQCYACNIHGHGEQYKFGKYLDELYGNGHCDRLFRLSHKPYKPQHEDYKMYIEHYEAHVAAILAKRIARDRREREKIPPRIKERLRLRE